MSQELFVFVDQAPFWTRHNFSITGRFVSAGFGAAFPDEVPVGTITLWSPGSEVNSADTRASYVADTLDYLPFVSNPTFLGWRTPFGSGVLNDYRVEYDAEVARRLYARGLPSRLSATYAFGDSASCELVARRHGWALAEVQKFRLVPHEGNRVARVNMEIVSLARKAYSRGMWTAEQLDWLWRSYWCGSGGITLELPLDGVEFERVDSGEIWEVLVEGVLERIPSDPPS
jgi:hypothetical protein